MLTLYADVRSFDGELKVFITYTYAQRDWLGGLWWAARQNGPLNLENRRKNLWVYLIVTQSRRTLAMGMGQGWERERRASVFVVRRSWEMDTEWDGDGWCARLHGEVCKPLWKSRFNVEDSFHFLIFVFCGINYQFILHVCMKPEKEITMKWKSNDSLLFF